MRCITRILDNISKSTRSYQDFIREVKHYENFKFLPEEYKKYYYEVKASYLLKSFGKDLALKMTETAVTSHN